ncbi:MAG: hypothetical protein RSC05_04475 [Acinetobacter sp.]
MGDLITVDQNVIVEAFKIDGGAQSLFDRIAEQARSVVPDLSTDKGRKAIASMARKVASSKTAFDAHGKELKEQYTIITSKIDADRKLFRDACDALRDEIRKPLTEWEEAKEKYEAELNAKVEYIKSFQWIIENQSSDDIKKALNTVNAIEIDDSFENLKDQAELAKFKSIESLKSQLDSALKTEEQTAELERLRKEQQEREQRERDERIAKEAADKARIEAEAKALAEKQRFEREQKEQAELAKRQQHEADEREARLQAEKEAALLREEQLKQQAIEREKQAEIDRKNAIEQERLRIEREQADKEESDRKAEEARLANVEHMRSINNAILSKLCEIDLDESQAKAVISAIAKGQVPHVSIKY